MLLTEKDAAVRWCPFARAPNQFRDTHSGKSETIIANRVMDDGTADPDCLCLGSGCMAWRERIIGTYDANGVSYPYHPGNPLPDGWTVEKRGFCGIAGRPE